jgi:hypothetical protein
MFLVLIQFFDPSLKVLGKILNFSNRKIVKQNFYNATIFAMFSIKPTLIPLVGNRNAKTNLLSGR